MTDAVPLPEFRTVEFPPKDIVTFSAVHPKEVSIEFMVNDLAKSGLSPEDMGARPVPPSQAYIAGAYQFVYYDLQGQPLTDQEGWPIMFRERRELIHGHPNLPEAAGKYTQPGNKDLPPDLRNIPYIRPTFWEYKTGAVLQIVEGEKKGVCLETRTNRPTISIGGKDNWHLAKNPTLHPWIKSSIQAAAPERIEIYPDGDIRRPSIMASYHALIHALRDAFPDITAEIVEMPEYGDDIDELIVRWEQEGQNIEQALRTLHRTTEYREPLGRVVAEYQLGARETNNGQIVVEQHEANYQKLMAHPFYEGLWYNTDDHNCYHGSRVLNDARMLELLQFAQYNLSMGAISARRFDPVIIRQCKLDTRSGFLTALREVQWDGVERLPTMFIDFCGSPDTPLVREVGSKWLVSAVDRMLSPGSPHGYMVIAVGPQGIGKSSLPYILWGNRLVVDILAGELKRIDGDETLRKLHGGLLINFDEFSGVRGNELNKLKGLITSKVDTFRPKYGRTAEMFHRQFVIYGSANEPDILISDRTGQRRYAIIEMGQVQFAELEAATPQLWAEAIHKAEEGLVDRPEHIELASEYAQAYVKNDGVYEDIVEALEHYEPGKGVGFDAALVEQRAVQVKDNGEVWWWYTILQLKELGGKKRMTHYETQQLKDSLERNGWEYQETARCEGGLKKRKVWGVCVSSKYPHLAP